MLLQQKVSGLDLKKPIASDLIEKLYFDAKGCKGHKGLENKRHL